MSLSYQARIRAEGDKMVKLSTEHRDDLLALDATDTGSLTNGAHDTTAAAIAAKRTLLANAVTAFGTLVTSAVARFA